MTQVLFTRFDRGVSTCRPDPHCMQAMMVGGWWDQYPVRTIREQIPRQLEAGVKPWAARRFFEALGDGGVDLLEAFWIIANRDCAHLGEALVLCNDEELPDEWFRDAWRRSLNGGPVSIDLEAAKRVQFSRVRGALLQENKRRERDFAERPAIQLDMTHLRRRIRDAECPETLKQIWPEELAA